MRPVAFNPTDFGGVGDGVTMNTGAFELAVVAIKKLGVRGGGQLSVPSGVWLTAPFNLISHMTLFLADDAVILLAQKHLEELLVYLLSFREMSGGVSDITVQNVLVWSSRLGMRIKTAPGKGGYVRNISYRNITLDNVHVGIVIKKNYNEHPDEDYDPKALPVLENFSFDGVYGRGLRVPVHIYCCEDIVENNITFHDKFVGITYKKKHIFQCSYVEGSIIGSIFPAPCASLDQYDEQRHLLRRASHNITDVAYEV